MKRTFISLLLLSFGVPSFLFADEGMWMLPLLEKINISAMSERGYKLGLKEIFDTNQSALKDAIVIFNGGCTGEIVSDQGLLFTNHHCGYDQIQSHSTLEHNYLKDGFWASSLEEELPNPGCEVYFLERMEDVTEQIILQLNDTMSDEKRNTKINEMIATIQTEASDSGVFNCEVKSLFEGNQYYLYVYKVYKDIRLVGAPPSSIGKFGYDSDNWVWPRQTGDFSIFRVYTAPDGSPAEYSADNIPLQPKKYLSISLAGIQKDDFTFILGYPGETNRYLTSDGLKYIMDVNNDIRIKIRGKRQEILMKAMQSDSLVQIQYSAKYYKSSNGWKYAIGQNKELVKTGLISKKMQEQEEFQKWCLSDTVRMIEYGKVLTDLEQLYIQTRPSGYNFRLIGEAFFMAAEITDLASDFYYLNLLLNKPDTNTNELKKEIDELKVRAEDFFKNYHSPTDKEVLKAMICLYEQEIPESDRPAFYQTLNGKYHGNLEKFVEKMFSQSIFTNKDRVLKFLNNPKVSVLSHDLIFKVSTDILVKYFEAYGQYDILQNRINNLNRLYMKGRMEMDPEKFLYPDADFTIRLSYGTVRDYLPREAVHYDYFTTLKGVMEKEDSTNFEFMVPAALKRLYHNSDFGVYGHDSIMPVCFITDNDITGGNSGSPVMNAKGELIGIAFDGNWESMSSDFAYSSNYQRCICVDIRYVLFIIDKFAGASRILHELNINPN
jgi:hypothetical protein